MSDTYLVVPGDVVGELPGLFPGGLSAVTTPTSDAVTSLISTADVIITLHVRAATGQVPSANDVAAPIARRYITDWVKAQVIRMVYAGNDVAQVTAAAAPYAALAQQTWDAITAMGAQAQGDTGDPSPRIQVPACPVDRRLIVDDRDLDPRHHLFHGQRF